MFSSLTKLSFTKKPLFVFFLLLTSFGHGFSQVIQPGRFEVPISSNAESFEIVSGEDEGLFLYRLFSTANGNELQLVKLDTAFQEQWGGFMPVEKDYLLVGKKAFHGQLFLLFRYRFYNKNDLLLYVVNKEGKFIRNVIKGYIPFNPTEFQVTEKAVLIGGYYNRVPLVLHYSLTGFNSKVLSGIFNETGELTQVHAYDDGSFDVLISAFNLNRQRTIWIKNYDADGNLNSNFPLESANNRHLIFGRSIRTQNNMRMVAGVYGTRSAEFSHGIFVASIDPAGYQQIRYYQFPDLENFFKYMKAKKEERVKARIQRRKIKGKRVRMNYRFLVHELVPYKDQYILLGEAFYPRYQNVNAGNNFFSPSYGQGPIQNGRVFEGYFYTHAIVMGFNTTGKLLWDNSFEINDVRTFTLEQFVKLEMEKDKIALMYLFDNAIRTKIIQDNQVLEGKSSDPIKTGNPNEISVKGFSEKNRLEYWYKNYLFAYGIQEIRSSTNKDQTRRKVFYINKLKRVN